MADISPSYARFQKQPADTLYVCGVCGRETTKAEVSHPPMSKGSRVVTCRPCANRPICGTCCSPGTLDPEAPELQPSHAMASETKLLLHVIFCGERGVVCAECLDDLKTVGFDIRKARQSDLPPAIDSEGPIKFSWWPSGCQIRSGGRVNSVADARAAVQGQFLAWHATYKGCPKKTFILSVVGDDGLKAWHAWSKSKGWYEVIDINTPEVSTAPQEFEGEADSDSEPEPGRRHEHPN